MRAVPPARAAAAAVLLLLAAAATASAAPGGSWTYAASAGPGQLYFGGDNSFTEQGPSRSLLLLESPGPASAAGGEGARRPPSVLDDPLTLVRLR